MNRIDSRRPHFWSPSDYAKSYREGLQSIREAQTSSTDPPASSLSPSPTSSAPSAPSAASRAQDRSSVTKVAGGSSTPSTSATSSTPSTSASPSSPIRSKRRRPSKKAARRSSSPSSSSTSSTSLTSSTSSTSSKPQQHVSNFHRATKDPVCTYSSSDGRRCRMFRSPNHPEFCHHHAEQELRALDLAGTKPLAAELLGPIRDFRTATSLNAALGNLWVQLAEGRIDPRRASVLGFLSQLIQQTQKPVGWESIDRQPSPSLRTARSVALSVPIPAANPDKIS